MKSYASLFLRSSAMVFSLMIALVLTAAAPANQHESQACPPPTDQSITLALLLDTSNSMDGLIDQAKSQLWKIVNELAAAKCGDGSKPRIRIALYEYGNSGLSSYGGYIRQVSALTTDLDLISEKLFSLRTNGGDEFCGQVIRASLNQLEWPTSNENLKMIFIAGNEPFTQGPVAYQTACSLAKDKGVVVNTIFCGNFNEGINTSWKTGADLTGGTYMSIDQDRRTVYIETPYDQKIVDANDRLNGTYVYYGKQGSTRKEMQKMQDQNSLQYGKSNMAERSVSKSSHAYDNSFWDLVDATKEDKSAIAAAKEDELPEEMHGMTVEQRQAFVDQKAKERKKIQAEIQALNQQRQQYIDAHMSEADKENMLDAGMINAIKEKGKSKNFSWK